MNQDKTEIYEDLGKVVFKKKSGVKRLIIRVKRSGEINVTVPFFISYKRAEEFLLGKKDWINKTRKKINIEKRKNLIDENTNYKTFNHTLRIIRYDNKKLKKKISFPFMNVFLPVNMDIRTPECQSYIKKAIEDTYRIEAWDYLPLRLKYLSDKYSLPYSGFSIKKMKTRWGSCSVKNKINLNLYLMALPEELIDYIILHELMHTLVKNHRKEFWDKLQLICPEAIQLRKKLKNYSILADI